MAARSARWLTGEPCVDSWEGVTCCPDHLPLYREGEGCRAVQPGERRLADGDADTEGSSLYAPLSSDPSAVFPAGCSSGYVTGLPIDTARCVVVSVDLRANNLTGTLNVSAIVNLLDWVQVLSLG